MAKQWFDVDRVGLGRQAEEQGKGRLIGELVQNALDEADVTRIDITVALVPARPLADLTVEDDSPEGFRDLTHAYTLFAPSYKRQNAEQRLASTGDQLKQLSGRTLDARQQETVGQIRNYMDGARTALQEGDVRRASTLAQKAHLLAEDLVKH